MPYRTEPALDGVAADRSADRLGHDEAEARGSDRRTIRRVVPQHVQDRVSRGDPTTPAHGGAEVIRPGDPVRPGEQRLRGEFGATLATTSREDGAAGAGAHAQPETVHLGTTTVVRLEGSLAHGDSSKAQLCGPERCR